MGWRGGVRNPVDDKRPPPRQDEPHIPFTLLICMLVMALTFVIVIPLLGIMYMDMNNATNKAAQEIRKMQQLRRTLIEEYRSTNINRSD